MSEVYSVTYPQSLGSGVIPDLQNPQLIYPNALVMDEFSLTTSSIYEFDDGKRSSSVTDDDLQDTARPTPGNWVVDTVSRDLSVTRFDNITLSNQVTLSASTLVASESAGTSVILTATATFAVESAQTVTITPSGLGIDASDFILSSTIITIPTGETTGSVTFTVQDDTLLEGNETAVLTISCLLYTSPSPRDKRQSRMPSSA